MKKPCPPCPVPTAVVCVGEHDSHDVPCSQVAPWSCGVVCGRSLICGNHVCEAVCHEVLYEEEEEEEEEVGEEHNEVGDMEEEGQQDEEEEEAYFNYDEEEGPLPAGVNCRPCERPCAFPRPTGCTHPCAKGHCHPKGLCPPCNKMVKFRCHCKNMVKHLPCREIHRNSGNDDDDDKENIDVTSSKSAAALKVESTKSCGGACPKLMSCGHACTSVCHSGDCSDPRLCTAKVTLKCECKRLKKDFVCSKVQGQQREQQKQPQQQQQSSSLVPCDAKCGEILAAKRAKEAAAAAKKEEEEREKNARIAAEFERSMKGWLMR